jgi:hypothetical protein
VTENVSAAEFVPDSRSLRTLRQAAAKCRGCPLWADATRDRGRLIESSLAPVAALTVHPSAILRLRGHEEREEPLGELAEDLRYVVREMTRQR